MNLTYKKNIIFKQEIIISFSELDDELENHIYDKLSSKEFKDKTFEVLEIKNFKIIEMITNPHCKVLCNIEIEGLCNNPEINDIIKIDENFSIVDNLIIYVDSKVQIISELKNKKKPFVLKIKTKKMVANNIICSAEHIIE
jgi:hypothetical protein